MNKPNSSRMQGPSRTGPQTPSMSRIQVQAPCRLRRYIGTNERNMPRYENDDDDEILSYSDIDILDV